MEEKTHSFISAVEDEFGGRHPDALIGVLRVHKTTQELKESKDIDGAYRRDTHVSKFGYEISFWNSTGMRAAGKRSRPLINDTEGGYNKVLIADLDHPEIVSIIDSGVTGDELDNKIIEADISRRFS